MKLTLKNLLGQFGSVDLINSNFSDIETELQDKVLYRDNPTGEPNQMENDLDMNSNNIDNVQDINVLGEFQIQGNNIEEQIDQAANNVVQEAEDWANKTDATVDGSEYSSKEYALGDLTATGGSAKAWAIDASSPDGTSEKSAKSYAADADTAKTAAETAQTAAETAQTGAETAETNAQNTFETFQGIFLGTYASDPATDPNGNAIDEGDWYFNSNDHTVYIYDGSVFTTVTTSGFGTASTKDSDQNLSTTDDVDFNSVDSTGVVTASRFQDTTGTPSDGDFDSSKLGFWETRNIPIGGDYDSGGTFSCFRIGPLVVIQSDGSLSHTTSNTAQSADGVVPSEFRKDNVPNVTVNYTETSSFGYTTSAFLSSSGQINVSHYDSDGTDLSSSVANFRFVFYKY